MVRCSVAGIAAAMLLIAVSSSSVSFAQQSSSLGLSVRAAEGSLERAEVLTVDPASAAAAAGIQAGDLLLYAKGKGGGRAYFGNQDALNAWAAEQKAGSSQTVSIVRDGKIKSVKIKIPDAATQTAQNDGAVLGLVVTSTPDDQVEVVSVAPDSPAAKAGLAAGDVLATARGGDGALFALASQKDLETWAARQQDGAVLEMKYVRGGQRQSAQVTVANANKPEIKKTAETKQLAQPDVQPSQQAQTPLGGMFAAVGGSKPAKETTQRADGTKSAVNNAAASNDRLAQNVTTLNGTPTMFSVKLNTGDVIEAQVLSGDSVVQHKACWIEDDPFNVDPEICFEEIKLGKNARASYRHKAKEPEVFWIQAETEDAAAGSYSIRSRNGSPAQRGAEALAILEAMGTKSFILDDLYDGLRVNLIARYSADQPGRGGRFVLQYEDGRVVERILSIDNRGDLRFKEGEAYQSIVLPGIDGHAYFYQGENQMVRVGYRVDEQGNLIRAVDTLRQYDDNNKNPVLARHTSNFVATQLQATPEQITKMMLDGPGRIMKAKQQRMEDWGVLAKMIGRYWVFAINNFEGVHFWEWESPGAVMTGKYWASNGIGMAPYQTARFVHNEKDRSIVGTITAADKKIYTETYRKAADGSVVRTDANGTQTIIAEAGKDQFAFTSNGQTLMRRGLDDITLKMFVERTRVEQQRLAQAQAAERQRQAQLAAQRAAQEAQEEAESMDMLLNLAGNMTSVANGGDFGNAMMNTMVSAAAPELAPMMSGMQGGGGLSGAIDQAFAAQLNQAMPGVMDIMQGGQPNMANMSGGSINPYTGLPGPGGGGKVGGGVAGQVEGPNQALGLCPGFTQANYRTHAFNGGNDQQLFALCGQAFELYNIHLNAVKQGYSRADSKLSWDQHVAAVQQIRSWNNGN